MASIRIKRGIASKSNPVGKHGSLLPSGYQIFWVVAFPQKGIITKKDADIISKVSGCQILNEGQYGFVIASPSKEKQLAVLESVKGKLSKNYDCYIITDKQFGKCRLRSERIVTSGGNVKFNNSIEMCITSKQRAEMVTI